LFFVRDVTTNALVLTGALMDPDDSAR